MFLSQLYVIRDSVSVDDYFVICGDFNLPNLQWNAKGDVLFNSCNSVANDLIDCLSYCSFIQYNFILNHNGRTLDLMLSNVDTVMVNQCNDPLSNIDQHHPPLDI